MDDENIVKRELTALMGSDPTARFKLIQDSAHEVALDL
jgi:hypothetical protein